MAEGEILIDWRLADDDLWDFWQDLEDDIAAGRPVDMAYRAALKAEIEARDERADGRATPAADGASTPGVRRP